MGDLGQTVHNQQTIHRLGDDTKWLDARAAGRHAGVCAATILREARLGRLRGYKVAGRARWRFLREDVDAWYLASTTPRLVTPRAR